MAKNRKKERAELQQSFAGDQDLNVEELFALIEHEGMSLEEVRVMLKNDDTWLKENEVSKEAESSREQPRQ
jgi:hypothetical protein